LLSHRARRAQHRPRNEHRYTAPVTNFDALATELQATWHREIPLAAALAVEIAGCSSHEISVRAPLAVNRNVHGTVFAGSLFSVCVLTGWGMTWLALRERSLAGSIVIATSTIRYRRAVTGDFVCTCRADPDALDTRLAKLAADGRAAVPLACTIDVGGKHAVSFEGEYVVLGPKRTS
jgi:thioesterase domain-containing protein